MLLDYEACPHSMSPNACSLLSPSSGSPCSSIDVHISRGSWVILLSSWERLKWKRMTDTEILGVDFPKFRGSMLLDLFWNPRVVGNSRRVSGCFKILERMRREDVALESETTIPRLPPQILTTPTVILEVGMNSVL